MTCVQDLLSEPLFLERSKCEEKGNVVNELYREISDRYLVNYGKIEKSLAQETTLKISVFY
ncbi:hypothetical protein DHD80_00165 [Gramella sp. AN32]|nr:hypothetical protein [Gramella sp. AN32]